MKSNKSNAKALEEKNKMKAKALTQEDIDRDEAAPSFKMGEEDEYIITIEEEKEEERPKEEKAAKESKSDEGPTEAERDAAAAELQRKTPLVIRESLINFVIEQEMLLRIHDELKGIDGWLHGHPLILLAKLMEETGELAESLLTSASAAKVRREAADVGNLAMMIAHKSGKL